jgi:hypothetical protein
MDRIFGDQREFREYAYVLNILSRKDTVHNIYYERKSDKIDCNKCFPFGDGSSLITDYKNLEFAVNEELYSGSDTIFIMNE